MLCGCRPSLNQNIHRKQVISILENSYADADVIFIQEAAAAFVEAAKQVSCALKLLVYAALSC